MWIKPGKIGVFIFGIWLAAACASPVGAAQNELDPGKVWLDEHGVPINAHGGGILFYEGTYYWFGEHKVCGEHGNQAWVGVHVYASTNLYVWSDAGIALAVSDELGSDISKGCILERPKVLFNPRTKKFVMWFHLEPAGHGYGAARCGVAISDSPAGPYHFVKSFRPDAGAWPENVPDSWKRPLDANEAALVSGSKFSGGSLPAGTTNLIFRRDFVGGQMARDLTLFADDDGKAYLIAASEENATLHVSELSDDFLQTSGRWARILPGGFNEAPAIFKHAGKYYLITSGTTGWSPNAARLSVADSIFGPWTTLGNPCVGSAKQVATTFESQSTYVLPVAGLPEAFIFMADRWRPKNPIDGRYVWLPVEFTNGRPCLRWQDSWVLNASKP